MREKHLKKGWLSQKELIAKAMTVKGATLDLPVVGSHFYTSKPICSFEPTGIIATGLAVSGFRIIPPKEEGGKTEFIFDMGNNSSYEWRFAPGEKMNLTLSTYDYSDYEGGIEFIPSIDGNIYCQDDYLPGLVAFCVAAIHFNVPQIVREFVSSKERSLLVKWSEMNLEGIKSIGQLWMETSRDYPSRKHLPTIGIINPDPEPINHGRDDDFEVPQFIPKKFQNDTISVWEKQIAEFTKGLQRVSH